MLGAVEGEGEVTECSTPMMSAVAGRSIQTPVTGQDKQVIAMTNDRNATWTEAASVAIPVNRPSGLVGPDHWPIVGDTKPRPDGHTHAPIWIDVAKLVGVLGLTGAGEIRCDWVKSHDLVIIGVLD